MHLKENSQRLAGGCDMQGDRLTYSGTFQQRNVGILLGTEGHPGADAAPLPFFFPGQTSYPFRETH